MKFRSRLGAAVLGTAAFGVVLFAHAGPASAHVSIAESEAEAGAYSVLTFAFGHGCEGSPTSEIRIQIPESTPTVSPTISANWEVAKVMEKLDAPIEAGHGTELTERVSEVVYTAKTPLDDGYRDAFELSLQIPEDAAGDTLYFPTVQTCSEGETAWIEIPEDGQDPDDLEAPAPQIAIIAADESDQTETETGTDESAAGSGSSDDSGDGGGSSAVSWLALGAGVLGLGAGGTALARSKS